MWNKVVCRKKMPLLWVVSGPSGSGKTTLCMKLSRKKSLGIARSISFTTRAIKKGEKNHRDYVFISQEEFVKKIKKGELLEWQKVFGNFYGTSRKFVEEAFRKNKDVLLCIDVKGALEIKKNFAKRAVFVFIVAPSEKELIQRTKMRARENKEEMRKRLAFAKTELSYAGKYDYIIVNDVLGEAVKNLEAIIVARRMKNVLRATGKTNR
ncbi:MAG: guanylate kinase [Candidatus Omnitrophica bacterium]|nr:guanylate kinase [Candidatus Omnitrophota bacterium]